VSLELDCSEACDVFARPLLEKMGSGPYDVCSVMEIPWSLDEWRAEHKTARRRVDRCRHRGYSFRWLAREKHLADIHAINLSAPVRQGRAMSHGYKVWPTDGPLPVYGCGRHAIRTWGVFDPTGVVVAYLTMYRAGQLALVSQILGHADHLDNEVMWLLFAGALEQEIRYGPGMLVYNRHDSGTDGLRWWKEHAGFEATEVRWVP
jgi:hypothetical protein